MQLFHLAFDAKILLPLQSRPSRWLKAEQGRGGRAEAEKGRSVPPATEQRGWPELFPPWSVVFWADVLLSHRTAGRRRVPELCWQGLRSEQPLRASPASWEETQRLPAQPPGRSISPPYADDTKPSPSAQHSPS